MREIKFRVPCKCQKGHFRWGFVKFADNGIEKTILTWGPKNCDCLTGELGGGYVPVGEKEEYIGCKDKNDKEIYDGDIVNLLLSRNSFATALIKWSEVSLGWVAYRPETNTGLSLDTWMEYEVIGTICENPGLMEAVR